MAAAKKKHKQPVFVDKEPEFNVQINEPRALRKDLLESVREIIIFMQGYEQFRKIQEEKVTVFAQLRSNLRDINGLIENQLRKQLPKGKLHSLSLSSKSVSPAADKVRQEVPVATLEPEVSVPIKQTVSEIDELESQLQDIESQLNKMH